MMREHCKTQKKEGLSDVDESQHKIMGNRGEKSNLFKSTILPPSGYNPFKGGKNKQTQTITER